LERAGIPPELLQQADAVVAVKRGFRWIELAGQSLDTAQLGAHVGCATPIEDLGPYGRRLAGALTLYQYLREGPRFMAQSCRDKSSGCRRTATAPGSISERR